MLSRRPERNEILDGQEVLSARLQTDTRRSLGELRAEVEERQAAVRAEFRAEIGAVSAAVRHKAERSDVESALAQCSTTADVRTWLQSKVSLEELKAQMTKSMSETMQELESKADVSQLERVCSQIEERMEASSRESREDLEVQLRDKVDGEVVKRMVGELLQHARVEESVALMERKADVDDVNRSLLEVNRELSLRPTLTELNRVVGEQSLIMESLCSEHLLGRWIWKSGRTKGDKHAVPWNVQNINTNPENFVWEKDKASITCTAPGLYEVTFGFFTRRKPAVQLLINGEPVLSAVNSATYAVHHSSGRLAAVGPHSAGNITGLTLIDFLALPPKARVAVAYQGDEGEGFLGLRKM